MELFDSTSGNGGKQGTGAEIMEARGGERNAPLPHQPNSAMAELSALEKLAQHWKMTPPPTIISTKRRHENVAPPRLQPMNRSSSSSSSLTPSSRSASEQPSFRGAQSSNAWSDSLNIGLGPTRPPPSSITSHRRKLGISAGQSYSSYPIVGQVVSPASEGEGQRPRHSTLGPRSPGSAPESRRTPTPASSYFPPSSGFDSPSPPRPSQHNPIRLRRVGALGISVSDSCSSRDGDSSEPSRRRRRPGQVHSGWSNEDRRKSAQDKAEWGGEELGGDLDSAGVYANGRQGGVSEAGFRGIVDELAMQNQTLKARLRRYEATKVPAALKKDRLFEVRFFDGMPSDKRAEMESFFMSYVQNLSQSDPDPAFMSKVPLPSPLPSKAATLNPPPLPSPAETIATSRHAFFTVAPVAIANLPLPIAPTTAPIEISDIPLPPVVVPLRLPSPPLVPRRVPREHRKLSDRERLSAPSFSGVEPTSLSGTGSGMRISPSSGTELAKSKVHRIKDVPSSPADTEANETNSLEIVAVLEKLFFDSLHAADGIHGRFSGDADDFDDSTSATPATRSSIGTNEAYLGHLLDNDFLSGGWTYLNLVCTMAQIHRFSVILPFVQSALRTYSTKLEVSGDGAKVRWIGERPDRPDIVLLPHLLPGEHLEGTGLLNERNPSTSAPSVTSSSNSGQQRTSTSSLSNSLLLAGTEDGQTTSTAATSVVPSHSKASLLPASLPADSSISLDSHHLPATTTTLAPVVIVDVSSNLHSSSLGAQNKLHQSSYVPFFDKIGDASSGEEGSLMGDSVADSDAYRVEMVDVTSRTKLKETSGRGPIVFYLNGGFCSDLSNDLAIAVERSRLASLPAVEMDMSDDDDSFSMSRYPAWSRVEEQWDPAFEKDAVLYVKEEEEPALSLAITGDKFFISQPPAPTADSLPKLLVSGMTEVVPADLFTMTVTTAHPTIPPLSSTISDLPPPAKRVRLSSALATTPVFRHKVVKTHLVHQVPTFLPRRSSTNELFPPTLDVEDRSDLGDDEDEMESQEVDSAVVDEDEVMVEQDDGIDRLNMIDGGDGSRRGSRSRRSTGVDSSVSSVDGGRRRRSYSHVSPPPRPFVSAEPPSDYFLSLSVPLYKWSPLETGILLRDSSLNVTHGGQTYETEKSRDVVDSDDEDDEGNEEAIDLDELA